MEVYQYLLLRLPIRSSHSTKGSRSSPRFYRDSDSVRDAHNSLAAPPAWTYNELFDLLYRSTILSTVIPISVPFSTSYEGKPPCSHRKRA
ncbi:hypothetical protein EVAR_52384_1 [Eumeta japonica]|uniref:Uncharacterized protein n=1 Tax=Eumeta variegata TaxID=151549 RepID=A0A4C1ZCF0_EUMVA|nr:hypothetical protein EVAR_52384_1 [Eumeta japonica]